MIASGHPAVEYIDGCVRHVMLRQGVLGIKVCHCAGWFALQLATCQQCCVSGVYACGLCGKLVAMVHKGL